MQKITFLLGVLSMVLLSCSPKGTSISGTVSGAENLNVHFDKVDLFKQANQSLVSGKSDDKGFFKLNLEDPLEPGYYRLRVGARFVELILDGNESNLSVDGSLAGFPKYNVEIAGSDKSKTFAEKVNSFTSKKLNVTDLVKYVETEADPLIGTLLIQRIFGNKTSYMNTHKTVFERLKSSYPENPLVEQYQAVLSQMEQQARREQAMNKVKVGEVAPEIVSFDPDGKEQKLSDLKGQIVLLDFWASWCGPCRKANPHVVETYHKYKKQGFTVFSVSLDGLDSRTKSRYNDETKISQVMAQQHSRWLKAIEQDKLEWNHHVSDLKKWESEAAALYGVKSIPKTFLIDRDMKIAALNPRYDLEAQIKKLL